MDSKEAIPATVLPKEEEIRPKEESKDTNEDEDDDDDDDDYEDDDEEEEARRLHEMSEQAKENVRSQLREMKAIYRSIKQRNMEIPEQFRIPDDDLKLPREIYTNIHQKIEIQCDEVYRIHEYESAETIIQLDKIRKFYLDPIDTPSIVVKDISHILQTHTIRNRKVTQAFQDLVERNKEVMEEESRILNARGENEDNSMTTGLPPIKRIYAKDIIGEYESKIDTYDIETIHNIRHLEKRLEQRYDRECAWQILMSKKISPDYIPPEDEAALESAKAETGAFRLQTSDNFFGEQITVAQRRQKIIDMKIKMRESVVNFNKMVVDARNEKPKVLQECRKLEKGIKRIHVLLPDEYRRKIPPIYDMEPDETPETMLDITQEDVEAEENAMLAAAGLSNIKEDLMEEYFGIKKPEKPTLMFEEEDKPAFVPPTAARQTKAIDLEFESVATHRCRKFYFTPQNEADKKKFEVQFYPYLYRQEMLFSDLNRIIGYYHERIKYLHDFQVQLEIDAKIKMVGLITMISELDIAKEFDAQEKAIMERLRAQQAECKDAKHQMDKIQKGLIKLNAEQKKYEIELQGITKEVDNVIGGKGRFSDYLWRVFKKKIRVEIGEEEEAAEHIHRTLSSTSDSTDSSESTSQDSGSDLYKLPKQKLDINTCPNHLDRNVYNKVCELRQRKATLEQEVDEHKKTAERVSAEFLEIEKVYHKYEGRLGDISEEVRVLQRRRQKRMNDLKVMVVLRADQIQCMDMDDVADMDGDILDKLAQSFPGKNSIIIFPKGGSDESQKRSGDLSKKQKAERERYKKGRHMLIRLREELKKSELEVELLRAKVKKEMVMKFGQEVDLDKITAVIINLELLDNEILLDKMKTQQYKEREKVDEELDEVKYKLTQKIKENSKSNMMKAMMLERRRDLEYYIWKNEKANVGAASILEIEAGGGDVGQQMQSLVRISSSCLTNPETQSHIFSNSLLEQEMDNLRTVLKKQTNRISQLKDVLKKCRTKSGLPPLIKLCEGDIPTKKLTTNAPMYLTTTKELPVLNQYCQPNLIQCGVQTIYKGNITPSLQRSASFTQSSLENVDEITEAESNKILGDFSKINYDYSSGEEDEVEGGAAAVREFQEAISEMLPDDQEDFMKYLEDSEMLDIDEMETELEEDRSPNSGGRLSATSSLLKVDEKSERQQVQFTQVDDDLEDDGANKEEDSLRSRKSRKSLKISKSKLGNRKSYVALAGGSRETSDAKVMERVRRISMGTQLSRDEQTEMDEIEPHLDVDETEEQPEVDKLNKK